MKRKEPKEDLVSALILAESKLSARELYSMIMLLIVAGHETTVNLITNTVLALLENPNQLQLLKENPKLIDAAIEEGLRYYSPVEVQLQDGQMNLFKFTTKQLKRRYGCHCISFCKP